MERKIRFSVDLTSGTPLVRIFLYSLPLLSVSVLTVLLAPLNQSLYAGTVGTEAFTIQALLAMFFNLLNAVTCDGFGANADITTLRAVSAGSNDKERVFTMTFFSQMSITLVIAVAAAVLYRPIFRMLSVPDAVYVQTRTYYFCMLVSYFFKTANDLLSALFFGSGSVLRNLIYRTITPIGSLVSAFVFLYVLKLGTYGIALSGIPVTVVTILIFARSAVRVSGIRRFCFDLGFLRRFLGSYMLNGLAFAARSFVVAGTYLLASMAVNRLGDVTLIAAIGLDMSLTVLLTALGSAYRVFCIKNRALGNYAHLKKGFFQAVFGFAAAALLLSLVYLFAGRAYLVAIGIKGEVLSKATYCFRVKSIGMIPLSLLYSVRYFFETMPDVKTVVLSGCAEGAYCLLAAFVLIPRYGEFFAVSYTYLAWTCSAIFCIVTALLKRRSLFGNIPENKENEGKEI